MSDPAGDPNASPRRNAVRVRDPRRRLVSERLQMFFLRLRDQMSNGVEDLWKRVESRLSGAPRKKPDEAGPPDNH